MGQERYEMNITLDIETYRCTDPDLLAIVVGEIEAPDNYKNEEAIAKHIAKVSATRAAATALDGAYGRVICACYTIDNDPGVTCIVEDDESGILRNLFSAIADLRMPLYVGHNIGWDLKFLLKRAIVHRVAPPAHFIQAARAKPWSKEVMDTMTLWDDKNRISLHALCKVLGVATSKGDLDGSKVGAAYEAGELARIVEYCCADVRATRECYNRMLFA
jgi:3'-5' exonuclease